MTLFLTLARTLQYIRVRSGTIDLYPETRSIGG
jgi:hypothetical protein